MSDVYEQLEKECDAKELYTAKYLEEKSRRIYYQNIVYDVCNVFDKIFNTKTVCGTVEEPSDQVQLMLKTIHSMMIDYRRLKRIELDAMVQKYDLDNKDKNDVE